MKIRLLPIVAFAGSALLLLKILGLVLEDKYEVGFARSAVAQQDIREASSADGDLVAQSEAAGENAREASQANEQDVIRRVDGPKNMVEDIGASPSERAVLSSLGERRDELNKREQQLDLREQMLQATEERLNKKMLELKALEKTVVTTKKQEKEEKNQQILDLVKIYESMKAKNAARIFNRLEMSILIEVVKKMQPRKMADVLAEMDPAVAERLTIALASGGLKVKKVGTAMLPKIEGK
ncbi:MotE family protein [Polycladidibacter stylochi]|uniref:MotE family protein n=1 Tax=Polycladidibacter stylochi TaxID=1807766 RepID=UPI00082DF719|nr:hypothetical protein [Pseudovibrio stylochi]